MGKKKWQDAQNQYLTEIVEWLKAHEHVNISQSPYKREFFDIFADAYHSRFCIPGYRYDEATDLGVQCKSQRPLVSGDAIWSSAKELGWVHSKMLETEKRHKDIHKVMIWWDEWTYAWSKNPPPRRYNRKRK